MIPRQPPESSDDAVQDEVLHAVHNALNETVSSEALEVSRLAQMDASLSLAQNKQDAESVEVQIDRLEAYLKGPTAFTA